jgi:hypothetical protein
LLLAFSASNSAVTSFTSRNEEKKQTKKEPATFSRGGGQAINKAMQFYHVL